MTNSSIAENARASAMGTYLRALHVLKFTAQNVSMTPTPIIVGKAFISMISIPLRLETRRFRL